MEQELIDFKYFQEHQLRSVDFDTGVITTKYSMNRENPDIGSINSDGYIRVGCGRRSLRMKHRLIYFLYHGVIPEKGYEIDHIDNIRHHNWISNLRVLSKSQNNTGCINRNVIQKTPEQIHEICRLLQDTNLSDQVIADTLGYCTRGTVRDIKTRYTQKEIGNNYNWDHRGWKRSEAIEKQSID